MFPNSNSSFKSRWHGWRDRRDVLVKKKLSDFEGSRMLLSNLRGMFFVSELANVTNYAVILFPQQL